jgi:hypothetical protein
MRLMGRADGLEQLAKRVSANWLAGVCGESQTNRRILKPFKLKVQAAAEVTPARNSTVLSLFSPLLVICSPVHFCHYLRGDPLLARIAILLPNILAEYRHEDLNAMDRGFRWSLDLEPHSVATYFSHAHHNVISNHDGFADASRKKNSHRTHPREERCVQPLARTGGTGTMIPQAGRLAEL